MIQLSLLDHPDVQTSPDVHDPAQMLAGTDAQASPDVHTEAQTYADVRDHAQMIMCLVRVLQEARATGTIHKAVYGSTLAEMADHLQTIDHALQVWHATLTATPRRTP